MRHPVLTVRERVLIAVAVSSVTVGLRLAIIAATRGPGQPLGDMRLSLAAFLTSLILLPWGMTVMERFHDRHPSGRRWRTSAFVAGYGCLAAMFAVAMYLLLLLGESPRPGVIPIFAPQQGAWNVVLLLIADGIQRAIHGYRAAILEDERRHEADMAEAKDARQAIEQRTRPDTVIASLEAAAERTPVDPAGARLLLLRLARHQRMLLTRPSPPSSEDELRVVRSTVALFRQDVQLEIGHCEVLPELEVARPWLRALESALIEGPSGRYLVECDRREQSAVLRLKSTESDQAPLQAGMRWFSEAELQPVFSASGGISVELPLTRPVANERQQESSRGFSASFGSSPFTAALVVYFLAAILPDLRFLDRQPVWNLTVMTLTSAVLWLIVGPSIHWITALCMRLRLSVAVLLSIVSVLSGAAVVTAASFGLLWLVTTGEEFMLTFLPLVASRNANVALVVCTSSFAAGFSRMLLAARADSMRAQHETVRAEARELEARFQPHFLFNALASIVGLLRFDPHAAGEMCRLLARLVARSMAYAGIPSWTVKDEVAFVADYLAIQRRRFDSRLRIATWNVDPSAMDAAFPRLSLQPLIENIFVHAVAASGGVIAIGLSIEQRGRTLNVEVWNDVVDGPLTPGHGRGMAFVSNRVRDAGGRILVVPAVDRFMVHLTIPIGKSSRGPCPEFH